MKVYPHILGIDPGQHKSGYAELQPNGFHLSGFGIIQNSELVYRLQQLQYECVGIERIRNYNRKVGNSTFETAEWSGRFYQVAVAYPARVRMIPRKTIVAHLCGDATLGNPQVRRALLDRWAKEHPAEMGGGKEPAKGLINNQGPLYGVTDHVFSALAVAVTYYDKYLTRKDD